MARDRAGDVDFARPKTVSEVIGDALRCYRRYPVLFAEITPVLPVVAAAQIVAGLLTGLGFVALIVPGLFLYARWGVVAQAAAVDRVDWRGALRRSAELTAGQYLHVLGVLFTVGIFTGVLDSGAGALVTSSPTGWQVLTGIVVETVALSVGALTSAMLFFDLRARRPGAPQASESTSS